jgi:cold shock CspA family protein
MGNYNTNGRGPHTSHSAARVAPVQARQQLAEPEGEWLEGAVKWYDSDRAYGWLRAKEGFDILIHWRVLKKSGINGRELMDDMPVRFKMKPVPGRSPEATIVRFA